MYADRRFSFRSKKVSFIGWCNYILIVLDNAYSYVHFKVNSRYLRVEGHPKLLMSQSKFSGP